MRQVASENGKSEGTHLNVIPLAEKDTGND